MSKCLYRTRRTTTSVRSGGATFVRYLRCNGRGGGIALTIAVSHNTVVPYTIYTSDSSSLALHRTSEISKARLRETKTAIWVEQFSLVAPLQPIFRPQANNNRLYQNFLLNMAENVVQGSNNFKPKRPEPYDGKRDQLTVHTWVYKMEQFFALQAAVSQANVLTDYNKVLFASAFLSGNAATWWYTRVQNGTAPAEWEQFKAELKNEFVPSDFVQRARDKLRKLRQTTSVAKYLGEFRN